MAVKDKYASLIHRSDLISRDLSWITFNDRVLDQAKKEGRTLFEKLKFLAITASNADEFFMIRVGSLYNYIDYGKERIDYCGLRLLPFKRKLLEEYAEFVKAQNELFVNELLPEFKKHNCEIASLNDLDDAEKAEVKRYFEDMIYPMLTPMAFDSLHTFPVLTNNTLIFAVVTKNLEVKEKKKMSFVQIPHNLPRFYEINRNDELLFLPVEEIISRFIKRLFRNVAIVSSTLLRLTRNGDFMIDDEGEDEDLNFLEELKRNLKKRKTGRIVKLEIEGVYDKWLLKKLTEILDLDEDNIFYNESPAMIGYSSLWQIVNHEFFEDAMPERQEPVLPLSFLDYFEKGIFGVLKSRDVLLHHPYNSMDPFIKLLDTAAEDPNVLSIKITIYRLAKNSRITQALLNAAEKGKHVSVLFEVKARFDEENNMREGRTLEKAGCFVVYGVGSYKTHTKLCLIVRKEKNGVTRYVHVGTGNYNENTAKLYTDIGLMTTNSTIANDVSEFFNVITGHSYPEKYDNLLTAPREMRQRLLELIHAEADNAKQGLPSGIVFKMNSLQDKDIILALYEASNEGVPIELIIRGVCCIRPGRKGLSENIRVKSIVGEYLEHSRIYYFHNNDEPKVYSGSADAMARSFDRRLESLFLVEDPFLLQQIINILSFNIRDTENSYIMNEDSTFRRRELEKGENAFDLHKEFYQVTQESVMEAKLF